MQRGGKRPGAGAPKANLNRLKDGFQSKQLKQVLYRGTPQDWDDFLSRLPDDVSRVRVRTVAALLLIRSPSS